MIKVYDLHKSYGKLKVLKGITTGISRGEVVVVIGASGSGKSTFLRCLNLLEVPQRGKIIIDGVNITDRNVNINLIRQDVGMVFQQFNLFPHKKVLDNITLALLKVKKMNKKESRELALELLNKVGLSDKADAYPRHLRVGSSRGSHRQGPGDASQVMLLMNPPLRLIRR